MHFLFLSKSQGVAGATYFDINAHLSWVPPPTMKTSSSGVIIIDDWATGLDPRDIILMPCMGPLCLKRNNNKCNVIHAMQFNECNAIQ